MSQWQPTLDVGAGPIYQAIADAIERGIGRGELLPGDRLPPHRTLAAQLGVDLTTVTRAYTEARRRGWLEAVTGRGTFVRETQSTATMLATNDPVPIDLSMNLPPAVSNPSLPAMIQQGLVALLAGPTGAAALNYRIGAGSPRELGAAAQWLLPTMGEVDPDRIVLAPGGQSSLLAVLASASGGVLTDHLTYPGLLAAAGQLGLELTGVDGDGHGMYPDALAAVCKQTRARTLYLQPTIHNPVAITMPMERRHALIDIARQFGLTIVEDDAYGLLPSTPTSALGRLAPESVIHVATLAKVISPALRLAYVVMPDASRAARLTAVLRAQTLMGCPLTIGLATQWIRTGDAARVRDSIRAECAARQAVARDTLPHGSYAAHPEGLHVWLQLPPSWDRSRFIGRAQQQGLALMPSDAFIVGDYCAPERVRLSLGAASSVTRLRRALQVLAAIMTEGTLPAPRTWVT